MNHLTDRRLYKYHSRGYLFWKFDIHIQKLKVHGLYLKKYREHAK